MLVLQRVIWPQESFRVEKLIETIADIRHPGLLEGTASQSGLTSLSYSRATGETGKTRLAEVPSSSPG